MKAFQQLTDSVQPFQVERPGVRGQLVRLGPAVWDIVAPHDYPPPIASFLAELVALATVLASSLKYDGIFSLQLTGDGPMRLAAVDITHDGDVRGIARFDAERLQSAQLPLQPSVPQLLGAGTMAFTVDQGDNTQRYQGVTALEGTCLADCAHAYFRQSEQVQAAIHVCSRRSIVPGIGANAAALAIQRLPDPGIDDEEAEENWRRTVLLMSSVTTQELLASDVPPAALLYRLFHEEGVRMYRPRVIRHRCRCSRERVERTLGAFPRAELLAMADDGEFTVTCEFCKAVYQIDAHTMGAASV
ncbi:MAG: Hsp33 family molecular chaperone HslO [Hyphomicrobiales bacterium]|nr:Hsp33 family molecular chaperone HslO [Hyphomicrobiales bacterium]